MRCPDCGGYKYRRNADEPLQRLRRIAASGDREAQKQIGRILIRTEQPPENLQEFADWLLMHPLGLQGGIEIDYEVASQHILDQVYQQKWFLEPLKSIFEYHILNAPEYSSAFEHASIHLNIDDPYSITLTSSFNAESEGHAENEASELDHILHDLERELSEMPYLDLGYPEAQKVIELEDDTWNLEMEWDDSYEDSEDVDEDDPPGEMTATLTVELGIHHLLGVFDEAQINREDLLDLLPQ